MKMKAILEFCMDDPDDAQAHMRCIKSKEMALVLWEFYYNARKKCELDIDEIKGSVSPYETIDFLFKHFYL